MKIKTTMINFIALVVSLKYLWETQLLTCLQSVGKSGILRRCVMKYLR
jgi:hypothetical protein